MAIICVQAVLPALGDIVGIPSVPFTAAGEGAYDVYQTKTIMVDARYANATDATGWTLIPPTLSQFADTFADDFASIAGKEFHVKHSNDPQPGSIFLTLDNCSDYRDVAGRWTSEAYTLKVIEDHVVISGASPLGVWWGTRTLLQQIVLNGDSLALGSGVDSPGWNTRGIFVCANRSRWKDDT